MEKEPCRMFCGVLVRFHEVIKLQSFEFSVSDAKLANLQIFHPWFSLFYGVFDHSLRTFAKF